jgi:hypothetical protein
LTTHGEEKDALSNEQKRRNPIRHRWQILRDRIRQSARDGIVGVGVGMLFAWRGAKWTLDGLNYISPLLTAAATVGIAWLAYWQWDALHSTDTSIGSQVSIMQGQLTEMKNQRLLTIAQLRANFRREDFSIDGVNMSGKWRRSKKLFRDGM